MDPLQRLDLLQGSVYDLLQGLHPQQMPDSLQGLDPLQKLDLLQGADQLQKPNLLKSVCTDTRKSETVNSSSILVLSAANTSLAQICLSILLLATTSLATTSQPHAGVCIYSRTCEKLVRRQC